MSFIDKLKSLPTLPKNQKDILIIFISALILRTLYLIFMSTQYTSLVILHILDDSQTYMDIAKYLLGANVSGANSMLIAGPGYGFLLAAIFKLFGFGSWPILILQIALSSLACVYIYKICQILFENRIISFIAAFLAVISLTSISLSAAILTDSLFFFLLVISIYYFLIALNKGQWKYFIICGLILGLATLIRSIGLFFPAVLLFIAIIYPLKSSVLSRQAIVLRAISTGLIIIIIALPWAVKNNIEHGIFTIAETGTLAARNYLASKVIYEAESHRSLLEIRDWMASPKELYGRPETAKERHEHATATVKNVFEKYPGTFIKVYFDNIFENVGSLSSIHTLQLPQFRDIFSIYTDILFTRTSRIIIVLLSFFGLFISLRGGKKREALILLSIYGYFAVLSGVTYWQGSRIMYPGQLVWMIFFAIAVHQIYLAISNKLNKAD